MTRSPASARQHGAVMIVALIMLVIISVVVVSGYVLSSSDLRAAANMQFREEAVASANRSLEQVVSGSFLTALNTTVSSAVDINKDGTPDYTVTVAIPQCPLRVRRISQDAPSGYETGGGGATAGTYLVDWELTATVADTVTGASLVIHHGVRLPMEETDYQTYVVPCGLHLYTS